MPRPFMLHLHYAANGGLAPVQEALFSDTRIAVTTGGLFPAPRLHRLEQSVLVLAGHPIASGQRDDASVVAAFRRAGSVEAFSRGLNGSFIILIYDLASGDLRIINDRFSGLALYVAADNGHVVAGTDFRKVLRHKRQAGGGRVDPVQVWSLLALRRLLGEDTLAEGVQYLRSASILTLTAAGSTEQSQYWQPNLSGHAAGGAALVDAIAQRLEAAVQQHMSDPRRHGLLLSGGLDSRAIIAAADTPPTCITTCLTRNNEFAVAAEVASIAGAQHHFIPRPEAPHDGCLDEAAALAAMQVYNETQFMGYGPAIAPLADVVMIGLGLDIFFGGLYLPKKPTAFLGREGLHHRLLPLPADLADFYLGTVKYRLRTSDPASGRRPDARQRRRDGLRSKVEAILERGRGLGGSGYGLWEYMHVHNLSRHFSFPMMTSVRTFDECRAPGLDNDLFDLALKMTAADKCDGTPYQRAIARLNPAMMRVRNANTNLPAGWPLRTQTVAKAASFAFPWLPGMARRSPAWTDRSWPLPRTVLAHSPHILARAETLPDSAVLHQAGIFDPGAIRSILDEHKSGRADHAVLINLLLTVDSVLQAEYGDE